MDLVNGVESDAISVHNRGLAYGDGVFRTFALHGGKPLSWRRQYAKLNADCSALRIACPAAAILEQDLRLLASGQPDNVVKILITRGDGLRGYAIPSVPNAHRIVSTFPLPSYPRHYYEVGVRIHLCHTAFSDQPLLAGIKHLNRLENVLARSEWDDPDIIEGLICDMSGRLISGTMSNVFLHKNGVLFTPDLKLCGVAGVQRDRVLDFARFNKISCQITSITLDDAMDADELFVCNSVIGAWQVAEFNHKTWSPGSITPRIQAWLAQDEDK